MQNIDYSRRLKKKSKNQPANEYLKAGSNDFKNSYLGNILNVSNNPSGSFLYLFVGALLFFTSGLVIGLKINQNEKLFTSNEINTNTLNNLGNIPSNTVTQSNQNLQIKGLENSQGKNEYFKKPSFPNDLMFPPKQDQVNYIVQIGSFSQEEANKWGKELIKDWQELQGRLFRTSTGKLYLGYFYSYKEAKETLKKIKSFQNGVFEDAAVKKISF
ncbi:MAG: SPOR domain-containing protein [Leptospiraceae bacterium]|nr:SPOR domain-containing protein [Leptospiraceae bacterium]MCP5494363.1 SPOR domain-containing protein [Leptospiraceae bacterium]